MKKDTKPKDLEGTVYIQLLSSLILKTGWHGPISYSTIFVYSKKYLLLLYFYKSQIWQNIKNCCYIWTGVIHFSLSSLDRAPKHWSGLIIHSSLQLFFPQAQCCKSIATLSLFNKLQIFIACTCHATFTESKHTYFLSIPIVRRKFFSFSFFPRHFKMLLRILKS